MKEEKEDKGIRKMFVLTVIKLIGGNQSEK
jgi:hypothetical protein